jgi:hypothetical protein
LAKGIELTFRWVTPPTELQKALQKYGVRVRVAIKAVTDSIIGRMARLLDAAVHIPDRSQLRHSDSLPQRYPTIRQLEEGG